jgi:hypothetical protein
MLDYQGIEQFTVIDHSKKSPKYGVIGIERNSQQSIIQKKPKMRGYRGIEQFTAINHSNKAKTRGYRGKKQFTAIIYSKKAQNAGL